MQEVFGYSVTVDPRTYEGLVVEKIEGHNKHGVVRIAPLRRPHPERIYQKLITNCPLSDYMVEFRVDVYGDQWIWSRKEMIKGSKGFPNPGRTGRSTEFDVPSLSEVSPLELLFIYLFLKQIGMEYGSLDVIRDLDDRIYVIDATVNVGIPRSRWLIDCSIEKYIKTSAETFERMWV
jgi:hypothetical protein